MLAFEKFRHEPGNLSFFGRLSLRTTAHGGVHFSLRAAAASSETRLRTVARAERSLSFALALLFGLFFLFAFQFQACLFFFQLELGFFLEFFFGLLWLVVTLFLLTFGLLKKHR